MVAALLLGGCAGWRDRPGVADARSFYYRDNSGVSVKTLAAGVEQPLAPRLSLSLRGMTEQIVLERKPIDLGDPGAMQPTGHPPHEPDAVTSASATAGGGSAADELRFEGIGALVLGGEIDGAPGSVRASIKASREPDYGSLYGSLGGAIELGERNTTVSAFVGFGRDRVDPVEAPPGQQDDWPATHDRVNGGLTVSQLLTPDLVLFTGAGVTRQAGQLASPYRRALVRSTLFPEVVPGTRLRGSSFVALSWYVGGATALHVRQGLYLDDWDVVALIPELAVATAPAEGWLLSGRYRFYKQWAAFFYQGRYQELEPLLTGDARLGRITEHALGLEARWTSESQLSLGASYDLSLLDYEAYATDVIVGHVISIGISGSY